MYTYFVIIVSSN